MRCPLLGAGTHDRRKSTEHLPPKAMGALKGWPEAEGKPCCWSTEVSRSRWRRGPLGQLGDETGHTKSKKDQNDRNDGRSSGPDEARRQNGECSVQNAGRGVDLRERVGEACSCLFVFVAARSGWGGCFPYSAAVRQHGRDCGRRWHAARTRAGLFWLPVGGGMAGMYRVRLRVGGCWVQWVRQVQRERREKCETAIGAVLIYSVCFAGFVCFVGFLCFVRFCALCACASSSFLVPKGEARGADRVGATKRDGSVERRECVRPMEL